MAGSTINLCLLGDVVPNLSAWAKDDLIAPLLILVLGVTLGMGLLCLLLVSHVLRQGNTIHAARSSRAERNAHWKAAWQPEMPMPSKWVAVRSDQPRLVQAALGLHRARPCSWEEGLQAVTEQELFISTPVQGWVLIMGAALPDPSEDVDRSFRFILSLSQKVGRVQFFSVNRALDHHCWVKAGHGQILRAYAWAGHTLWNQGKPTREELELGMKCYDYIDSSGDYDYQRNGAVQLNTEKLPLLAARWSLDPTMVDPRWLKGRCGVKGELPRFIAY